MNYACQESKRDYTWNIDRRNAALRIWSVYDARYRENTRIAAAGCVWRVGKNAMGKITVSPWKSWWRLNGVR